MVGSCTTGAISLTHQFQTGNAKWGKRPVAFASHFESWQIRSSPKGRIGQPLAVDEFREVIVLLRNSVTKKAKITTIKLWRTPDMLRRINQTGTISNQPRSTVTYGALGISCHGVAMFSQRADKAYHLSRNCDCHSVLSAVATVLSNDESQILRIEVSLGISAQRT